MSNDIINHPNHYKTQKGLETIDVIEAFTEGLHGGFATNTGNVIKYICRWNKKNGLEDLKKARWYLNRLIDMVESGKDNIPETEEEQVVPDDSWDDILSSLDDGTYKTRFKVGDTRVLDLGPEGRIPMRLVGIDEGVLANCRGNAKMTWIADETLVHTHTMIESFDEATPMRWSESDLRKWLNNYVKTLIPEAVRDRIAAVIKCQNVYDPDTVLVTFTEATDDELWIPSYEEIFGPTCMHAKTFPDAASRIKYKTGSTSAASWWLRSAYNANYFYYVYSNGDSTYNGANSSRGVALGFCLN